MELDKNASKQHANKKDKNVVMIKNSTVIVGCSGDVELGGIDRVVLDAGEEEVLRIYKGLTFRKQVEFLHRAIEFENETSRLKG